MGIDEQLINSLTLITDINWTHQFASDSVILSKYSSLAQMHATQLNKWQLINRFSTVDFFIQILSKFSCVLQILFLTGNLIVK